MKVRPISHHVSERLQPNSGTLLKRLIDLTTKCEVVNTDVPAQRAGTKEARDRAEASEKAPYLRNPPLRRTRHGAMSAHRRRLQLVMDLH